MKKSFRDESVFRFHQDRFRALSGCLRFEAGFEELMRAAFCVETLEEA